MRLMKAMGIGLLFITAIAAFVGLIVFLGTHVHAWAPVALFVFAAFVGCTWVAYDHVR